MIEIGNTIALLALLGWPLVAVVLFRMLPLERALIWSILGAYMILPQLSAIDLPVIPALDKVAIPNLMAFALCLGAIGLRPDLWPTGWLGRGLLALFVISPSVTVLTNLDPILFGMDRFGTLSLYDPNALQTWGLPGLRPYDSGSALAEQAILILPFFLARAVLRTEAGIREILTALVIAAALYALPMLWEVRFSPQLHTQLYGFFQHDFAQAIRGGGFRPFVFMPHGLWVAFFAFMCAMAAATWLRMAPDGQKGKPALALAGTILLVLICKSMGAIVFTAVFVPAVLFLPPRLHLAVAAVLAMLVMSYPILRGAGIVPTQALVSWIDTFNPERAQSLDYRFTNEGRIIAHTNDKPLFGWGGWGRFMVYDERTGESRSVVDGQWVITISHYGWLGYIALFGLLALPLISLWWQARKPQAPPVPVAVSSLALMLAVNMLDLLPNATLIPFTWLIAGALLGFAEDLKRSTAAARTAHLRNAHAGVAIGSLPQPARQTQTKPPKRRSVL